MAGQANIPHVLMILDEFFQQKKQADNAFSVSDTPNLDRLIANHPHGLITTSGTEVGLPAGHPSNSEIAHMNMGVGRIILQDSTRISRDIHSKSFYKNPVLVDVINTSCDAESNIHILGLLSDAGIHSHQDHIEAMCHHAVIRGAKSVYIHCFLDGRDTPAKSADKYLNRLRDYLQSLNSHYGSSVQIASICGRFFSMDNENNWERTQQAYEMLTEGKAVRLATRVDGAIQGAYKSRESDEFVSPTIVLEHGETPLTINDDDVVISMNFRADGAIQLAQAFVLPDRQFSGFSRRKQPNVSAFVMLTQYSEELANANKTHVAYHPLTFTNSIGEYLQSQGKTQLRLASTQKYINVTSLFNGGHERYTGETHIVVPSVDEQNKNVSPENHTSTILEITKKCKQAIETAEYDLMVVNYSGNIHRDDNDNHHMNQYVHKHTENYLDIVHNSNNNDRVVKVENKDSEERQEDNKNNAKIKITRLLDTCVAEIADAVQQAGGHLLITAGSIDHGQQIKEDCEQTPAQNITERVPLIYIGNKTVKVVNGGRFADIAPTLLSLMQLPKPQEMTGYNLLLPTV